MFIHVILPLRLPEKLIYSVPEPMRSSIQVGTRVLVPLGESKLYAAVVGAVVEKIKPVEFDIKDIIRVIGNDPIVTRPQIELWQWIADYYMCSEGEVMRYFMPADIKIEAFVTPDSVIYKPNRTIRKVKMLRLSELITTDEQQRDELLDSLQRRAKKQYSIVMKLMQGALDSSCDIINYSIPEKELLNNDTSPDILRELIKKNIIQRFEIEQIRENYKGEDNVEKLRPMPNLSTAEAITIEQLNNSLVEHKPLLYHTSQSRINLLMSLINECFNERGSVMVLMPEINRAITTELRRLFGDDVVFNNPKSTPSQRYEIYCKTLSAERCIVMGGASSVGLPVRNLKLIIVFDEHNSLYKNSYTAPRFNSRDCAVVLARLSGADVVLESHTPSVDSFHNTKTGKYSLVTDSDFQQVKIKEIDKFSIATKERILYGDRHQVRYFSKYLLEQMQNSLERGQNVFLYHPRRGYNSYMECGACGAVVKCKNCNVTLTYHKQKEAMICHYCNYSTPLVRKCEECNSEDIRLKGIGSQHVEESINEYFPQVQTVRIDSDTFQKAVSTTQVMQLMEQEKHLIIVGTQLSPLIAQKANIGVVGVVDADKLFNISDYRAEERAFQQFINLSAQCSNGVMVLQCTNPRTPIAKDIVNQSFESFYDRELTVRRQFNYPPFVRHLKIVIKHKDEIAGRQVAQQLAVTLRNQLNIPIVGVYIPPIDRINNFYMFHITVKLPRTGQATNYKEQIRKLVLSDEYKRAAITLDVDPKDD